MTAAQYAPAVKQAGIDLGITPKGIVIAFATVFVESNWTMYANESVPASIGIPHEAVGSDGDSVGLFQQQVRDDGNGWWWGDAATCMDPYKSAVLFFTRLAKLDYNSTTTTPGGWAQAIQQSAYPGRYDQRMGDAQALYDSLAGLPSTPPEVPVVDPNRPAYNEFPIWDNNEESRQGTKVDLFLLHTQEPPDPNTINDSAAEDLANYFNSPAGVSAQVSYDYTISQASDGGVTLVDCVNTDDAAWSVGSANLRSINLCFAGSSANWTRDQWMSQSNAIDVAAYVAVQDCKKYGIPLQFIGTGGVYDTSKTAGVADHRYVTDILGWGTHTDVGVTFPKDLFLASFLKYAALDTEPPSPPPVVVVTPPPFAYPSTEDMVKQIWEQLFGPQAQGFPALFGQNPDGTRGKFAVEAIAALYSKLGVS